MTKLGRNKAIILGGKFNYDIYILTILMEEPLKIEKKVTSDTIMIIIDCCCHLHASLIFDDPQKILRDRSINVHKMLTKMCENLKLSSRISCQKCIVIKF